MSQSQTCSCANRNCFHDDCACFTREGLCSEYCKCRGDCKNIWKNEKEVTKRFVAYTKRKAAQAAAAAAQAAADQAAAAQAPAAQAAAAQAPAAQAAAAQAAAQPQPKPLPALEPGSTRKPCHCASSKCQNKYCRCLRDGLICCDRCDCKNCGNTKTREEKLQDLGINVEALASGPTMMTRGAAQAAKESAVGCKCQGECTSRCGCVKRNIKCTSKCKCKRCGNDDGSRFPNKAKAGPGGQGGTRSSSSAIESTGKRPKHV